jgi:hypothetical protein
MKNIIILLISIILAISIAGCTAQVGETTESWAGMESWVGRHYSESIEKWGPATRESDDGSGGKILVWEEIRSFTTPTGVSSNQTYQRPRTTSYRVSRSFWVNSEGIIYKWGQEGM